MRRRLTVLILAALFNGAPSFAQPTIDATYSPDTLAVTFSVTPDAALLAAGGDSLGVELAVEVASIHELWRIELGAALLQASEWASSPALNPFTGEVTSGITFVPDGNVTTKVFASFDSAPLATADSLEYLFVDTSILPNFDDGSPFWPTSGFDMTFDAVLSQGGSDFSVSDTLDVSPPPRTCPDLDCDGDIDVDDFGVFVNSFQLSPQGGPPYAPGDFDEDGDVDLDDFGVFVGSFQMSFSTIVTSAGDSPGPIHVGDFDWDGDVDLDDFGVFVDALRGPPPVTPSDGPPFIPGDFDMDGDVDTDDFGVFVDGFQRFPPAGSTVSVPEPSSLLLAGVGAALAAARRKTRKE